MSVSLVPPSRSKGCTPTSMINIIIPIALEGGRGLMTAGERPQKEKRGGGGGRKDAIIKDVRADEVDNIFTCSVRVLSTHTLSLESNAKVGEPRSVASLYRETVGLVSLLNSIHTEFLAYRR